MKPPPFFHSDERDAVAWRINALEQLARDLLDEPAVNRCRLSVVGEAPPPAPPLRSDLQAAAATLLRVAACLRHEHGLRGGDPADFDLPF